MIVGGTYQDVQFIEGEWNQRVGMEAGRGYVIVLLKDIGGALPESPKLEDFINIVNRNKVEDAQVQAGWMPKKQGSTITTTVT